MSHPHKHINNFAQNRSLLMRTLLLTGGFMFVEAVAGILTNSLALLADAGHMLADVTGLGLAFFAAWICSRSAPTEKTYGWFRTEILASTVNAMLLFGVACWILYEAWQRLFMPPEVRTTGMLLVAVLGLIVNMVGLKLLSGKDALYMRAATAEVLADALGSVGVLVAGGIILFTGLLIADPLISIIIALAILPRTWGLLKEAMDILLEAVPAHIDVANVRKAILNMKGIRELHDLHVWQIATGFTALSCHIIGPEAVLPAVRKMLHDKFDIWHSTIQHEPCRIRERGVHGRWRAARFKYSE